MDRSPPLAITAHEGWWMVGCLHVWGLVIPVQASTLYRGASVRFTCSFS